MLTLAFVQGCSFETASTQDHFGQVSKMFQRVGEIDFFSPSPAEFDHGFCSRTLASWFLLEACAYHYRRLRCVASVVQLVGSEGLYFFSLPFLFAGFSVKDPCLTHLLWYCFEATSGLTLKLRLISSKKEQFHAHLVRSLNQFVQLMI